MGEAEISSEFEYSASFLRILIPGVIAVTLAFILVALNYSHYFSIFMESINESIWAVLPIGVIFVLLSMLIGLMINVFNTRLTRILMGFPLFEGFPLDLSDKKHLYLFCWNEVPGKDEQRLRRAMEENFGIKWAKKAKISKSDDNRTIFVNGNENSVEITLGKMYLFSWDGIPGNDSGRLIEFLTQKYGFDWIKAAKIEKIDDSSTIIVSTKKNYLLLRLNNEKTKIDLKIDDGRTDELIVNRENDKLNIYNKMRKIAALKIAENYLFSWDGIPGNESGRLIEFLTQKYGIDWVKAAKILKIDDGNTIRVSTEKNYLLLRLNNEKTKADLKIDDGRTDELIVNKENDKLNIYAENKNHPLLIKEENNKLNVYQKKLGILKKMQWEKFVRCRTAFKSAEQESNEKGQAYTNLLDYYSHCLYKKAENPDRKDEDLDEDLKDLILPTELGNVFCSMERYPEMKYGMNGIFFWSRIQFVVDAENKPILDKMRAFVDMFVELTWIFISAAVVYSITFAYTGRYLYSFSSLVIFTLFSLASYKMAVQSALDFGSYFRSVFDLYRNKLWEQIKCGQFDKLEPLTEKERWRNIFRYLWFHKAELCHKCGRFYQKTEEHKCE